MLNKKKRRQAPEVNAGSMADIAFLLLIFFLVTTVIESDSGIRIKLPPWEPNIVVTPINEDNVLTVKVNANNDLLVEKERASTADLRQRTKLFIMNPQKLTTLPSNPKKAVISLQNDRGTSYETYLAVYNELKAAYRELWEEAALAQYQKSYELLDNQTRDKIREGIPLVISEAEPTDYLESE
ncbi:MAG: biopolymer transporter ExbD [Saprospiraceae bacterium]|nr:MAG: biopolymer transporter ExbD [Saprospiraceae bacterium]